MHVDEATRLTLLENQVNDVKSELADFRAEVKAYFQSSRPRLNVWIPSLAIVLGGFWFVLNLQVTSSMKGFSDSLARMESQVATNSKTSELVPTLISQNADSIRDRQDLNKKFDIMILRIADIDKGSATDRAERKANEAEVETQIDAMGQSLSVQFANQQRMNTDLQNALHDMGAKYPAAPNGPFYFPNISNRNHRKP